MKIKDGIIQLTNYKKKSSVLSPSATQLNNMADKTIWRLMEILIVFLMTTWNQVKLLSKPTNVHVTADYIEACHRIGKSKKNSKKTIVRFIDRKHCKCALVKAQ